MKINLVIPAKGTSERLKNKNLLKVDGKSLTEITCEKVLQCKNINNVFIDTDSDKIIQDVSHLFSKGLQLIKRPKELANNYITANDLMIYALHSIPHCDVLLQTFVTSPLIKPETIDKSIELFLENKEHDAFLTTAATQEYFWDKNSKPINFDINTLPNSVDLETIYMETHGLYGIYTESLLQNKNRFGENTMLIPISKIEALDINDHEDMKIFELLYKNEI